MEVSKMASEKMLHLLVIQVIHSFYEVLLMMAFSKKQFSFVCCCFLVFHL